MSLQRSEEPSNARQVSLNLSSRRSPNTPQLCEPSLQLPSSSSTDPADRPSHVSLLSRKYLLFANSKLSGGNIKCINIETREQFLCKIVPRNAAGVGLLAAYRRLEDCSDCIGGVREIVLTPKSLFFIFQVNYGSLHSYIFGRKNILEPEAAHIFKQIVTAVDYCHRKGIVLRDLKMSRFVFTDKERTTVKLDSLEGAVILNDFSDDLLSDKHGCPNYVSPEKANTLCSNSKYPGKASDIWGLGVILYKMLVGRYPFKGADHSQLFAKIRKGNFSIPDIFSTHVKCLIRCLLTTDPNGRLRGEEILRHPWILRKGSPTRLPLKRRKMPALIAGLAKIRVPPSSPKGKNRSVRSISKGDSSSESMHAPLDTIAESAVKRALDKSTAQEIGLKLRNLLKLPKAYKWVCYEWFYSNIDKVLFDGENGFQTCLRKSFPQLKARRLRRTEWTMIRRLLGNKPRLCSQSFFEEERKELARCRQKIRMIQQRKVADLSCKELPDEIPLQLVIGTKVTARLRRPHDGLFTGVIQGVDYSNNTYSITFDIIALGTQSIPDFEVLSIEAPETVFVTLCSENFSSKL